MVMRGDRGVVKDNDQLSGSSNWEKNVGLHWGRNSEGKASLEV